MPDPGDPQSLNRYSYTLNNPVRYIDPSGHCIEAGLSPIPCAQAFDFAARVWQQVQALVVQYGPQIVQGVQQFGNQIPAVVDQVANSGQASGPASSNAGNTAGPGGPDPKDPWFGRLLTGQETRQLTEKATQLGEERITVIGRWKPTGGGPNYIDVAERMRATFLELETPIASRLTPEQFNQVNAQFLRDAVARGDRIFLGTEIGRMVGQLAWEITFLEQELGLVLGPDGWFLPK